MRIERVQWPERSCREPVWSSYVAHSCELPDLHHGPCVSQSVTDSIRRREAWEKAQQSEQEDQNA